MVCSASFCLVYATKCSDLIECEVKKAEIKFNAEIAIKTLESQTQISIHDKQWDTQLAIANMHYGLEEKKLELEIKKFNLEKDRKKEERQKEMECEQMERERRNKKLLEMKSNILNSRKQRNEKKE